MNQIHDEFMKGDSSWEFYDLKLKIATIKQDIDFMHNQH